MPTPSTVLVFALYLIAVVAIAWFGWRRTHSISDYVLGGRSLSPFTAALSTGASNMSGWIMLAFPALAYANSLKALLMLCGLLAGQYASVRLVAPRLRVYSEQLDNAQTLPRFLCQRTGRSSRDSALLRGISSLVVLIFMLLYVASGLLAGGKLFSSLLDISLSSAIIWGTVVIGGYTLLGGFLAICWTDVLQALMMLVILVGLPIAMVSTTAAPAQAAAQLPLFNLDSLGLVFVISALSWGLGYIGMPHSVMRFKALRDVRTIPSYLRLLMGWLVLVFVGSLAIGLAARGWYLPGADAASEDLTLQMVARFFNPWVAGLALSAIMAAVMSTADSQLLLASVSISEDIIAPMLPGTSAARRLRISRLTVLAITLLSLVLVLRGGSSILSLVSYAWAGLGAAFGPVLVFALFWRRFNYAGAVAGVATGGLGTIVLHNYPLVDGLYELLPAFALSALAVWLAGRFGAADPAAEAVFNRLVATPIPARDPGESAAGAHAG